MPSLIVAAAWSFFRMLLAYIFSLIFSIPYGLAAATSPKRERWMIPLIDILQSVPIVTFFPVAILFFVRLGGGGRLGAEMASIFLIFTCQVWNLAFSVYETMKTYPRDLLYLADVYKLPPLTRIRYFYIPAMIPGLVYNSMMSWANGWYFLIASEIFSVGAEEYRLPGLGTEIITNLEKGNILGLILTLTVLIVIVLFMQIVVWNSLRRWATLFEYGNDRVDVYKPKFIELLEEISYKLKLEIIFYDWVYRIWNVFQNRIVRLTIKTILGIIGLLVGYGLVRFLIWMVTPIPEGIYNIFPALGMTTVRILIAYMISLILVLVPGYWVSIQGDRSKEIVDGFITAMGVLSSIPASAFFPPIIHFMAKIIGSLEAGTIFIYVTAMIWYLMYNVLLGAVSIPRTLKNMAKIFKIKGSLFLRVIFVPSVFPSLITGSITGWGGAWNASVIAEYMVFSTEVLSVFGIGSFLVKHLTDNPKLMMWGAAIMTFYVVLLNRLVWLPLYNIAERRYRRGEW